jgi:hypothetical protein
MQGVGQGYLESLGWKFNKDNEGGTKMNIGDTVLIKGCEDATEEYNGRTGKYLGVFDNVFKGSRFVNLVSFDGTDEDCGYLFADSELEVVPSITIGDKVTVTCIGSYANAMEFKDGTLTPSLSVKFEVGTGTDIAIYEVTGFIGNDTIIRRISDGRVFFVQQRFLKAYVAVPKFKRGDFVTAKGRPYYRVFKVFPMANDEFTYGITAYPDTYKHSDGNVIAGESELVAVTQ